MSANDPKRTSVSQREIRTLVAEALLTAAVGVILRVLSSAALRVEVISLAIASLFFGVAMYSAATMVVVLCLLTLAAEADWG